jgi:hypothetical protein
MLDKFYVHKFCVYISSLQKFNSNDDDDDDDDDIFIKYLLLQAPETLGNQKSVAGHYSVC